MEAVDYHSDPESHVKEREALLLEQSNAEAHAGGTISPISPTPSSASSSSNGGGAFDENGGRQLSFDQSRDGAGGGGRFGGAGGDGSGAGGVSGHVEAAAMAVRYQQRAKSTIRSSTGVTFGNSTRDLENRLFVPKAFYSTPPNVVRWVDPRS